jgi:hypothetical protein
MNNGIIPFPLPPAGQLREEFYDIPGTFPWSRPRNLVALYYEITGGGGGGGAGEVQVSAGNRRGGSGGAAGEFRAGWLFGSQIPDSGLIVVGAGGAGASSSAPAGATGTAGGSSSFCSVLFAAGGAPGAMADSGAAGFNFAGDGYGNVEGGSLQAGRQGGSAINNNAAGGHARGSTVHPGGGGAGGSAGAGNTTPRAGGDGGVGFAARRGAATATNQAIRSVITSPAGATIAGALAIAGTQFGDGGGGGAYITGAAAASANGANGAFPGGGGGGSAGADSGIVTAGNGGGGMVRLYLWVPT